MQSWLRKKCLSCTISDISVRKRTIHPPKPPREPGEECFPHGGGRCSSALLCSSWSLVSAGRGSWARRFVLTWQQRRSLGDVVVGWGLAEHSHCCWIISPLSKGVLLGKTTRRLLHSLFLSQKHYWAETRTLPLGISQSGEAFKGADIQVLKTACAIPFGSGVGALEYIETLAACTAASPAPHRFRSSHSSRCMQWMSITPRALRKKLDWKIKILGFCGEIIFPNRCLLPWIAARPLRIQMRSQPARSLLCLQLRLRCAWCCALSLSPRQCVHCHPEVWWQHVQVHPS